MRSPIANFGMAIFRHAGDCQATRVPHAVHMQSTDGDLKISLLMIGIDVRGGNTFIDLEHAETHLW